MSMSKPVTAGKYGKVETSVYTLLFQAGFNQAAICGILANIDKESSFNPTASGDSGTSYGLCQWHKDRKKNLQNYCKGLNLNYTTEKGQIAYLLYELITPYYKHIYDYLKSTPNTSEGAYNAGYYFCYHFEVPADKENVARSRGTYARSTYWSAYSRSSITTTPLKNKGSAIVEEARKHIGKPYKWGGQGESNFDCSGLVYYVYKKVVNLGWERLTSYGQYTYKDAKVVKGTWKAGDLVFFVNTRQTGKNPNISHVGIATGNGDSIIHCDPVRGVEEISLARALTYSPYYHSTKRILADNETSETESQFTPEETSESASAYDELVFSGLTYSEASDRYLTDSLAIRDTINTTEGGTKYGYLVDLTNGGEFRFIVPEYDESVKANWENTTIMGRSAEIVSYSSTSSRSLSISLELIAGAGLYVGNGDRVDAMHKDIAFVKSLEYPDYSKAIAFPPPVVYLYLNEKTQLKGVVSSVDVKYKKPYDSRNRPMFADLSFTVTQVSENPPDYRDIRTGADNSY